MEAAAELVVHAAAGHLVERLARPSPARARRRSAGGTRSSSEQRARTAGTWARRPKPAEALVEVGGRSWPPRGAQLGRRPAEPPGARGRALAQVLDDARARLGARCRRAPLSQRSAIRFRSGGEAGAPVAVVGREVGAGEERLLLGRQEHGHRPAALALVQRQGRGHVDVVEVGPLLAVHLDAHEVRVHERRDVLVLEGLALHDVAPVAGRVADAEQDRLVLGAGARQAPLAPRDTSRRGCGRAAGGRGWSRG